MNDVQPVTQLSQSQRQVHDVLSAAESVPPISDSGVTCGPMSRPATLSSSATSSANSTDFSSSSTGHRIKDWLQSQFRSGWMLLNTFVFIACCCCVLIGDFVSQGLAMIVVECRSWRGLPENRIRKQTKSCWLKMLTVIVNSWQGRLQNTPLAVLHPLFCVQYLYSESWNTCMSCYIDVGLVITCR